MLLKPKREIMNLCSKLSARWARIYQQPIDKLACMLIRFVNMACSITPVTKEDYITRRWMLKMSRASLQVLEKRVMDMVRILYNNPSKCESRKSGKNYSFSEATVMLDKRLEELGVKYQRQYYLIVGALESDKKKYNKIKIDDISYSEIVKILVSKSLQMFLE